MFLDVSFVARRMLEVERSKFNVAKIRKSFLSVIPLQMVSLTLNKDQNVQIAGNWYACCALLSLFNTI